MREPLKGVYPVTNSNSPAPRHSCVSDSPFTEIFYDDGEGDTTVHPIPPDLLPQAMAERQKIQEWLQQKAREPKPEG
jgi:hypothetical protein